MQRRDAASGASMQARLAAQGTFALQALQLKTEFCIFIYKGKQINKPVKRYSTFEDLKSCENNPVDHIARLKKHTEFEKFIASITPAKDRKKAVHQSK